MIAGVLSIPAAGTVVVVAELTKIVVLLSMIVVAVVVARSKPLPTPRAWGRQEIAIARARC